MFLVSLIYASKVTDQLYNEDGVVDIAKKASQKNETLNVTGVLYFDNNYFLQCLEGSRSTVNKLYSTIVDDPRHSDVLLLQYGEINTRSFSDWGMGLALPTKSKRPLLLKYSPNKHFNPFEISGESAKKLLVELATSDETKSI